MLQRNPATRQPRVGDSSVNAEDYIPGPSPFMHDNGKEESSPSAHQNILGHTPKTDEPLTVLTDYVGIPPNLWELKQLEAAVCCHDFNSLSVSKDHGICVDKQPVLNAWISRSAVALVSFFHAVSTDLGFTFRSSGQLLTKGTGGKRLYGCWNRIAQYSKIESQDASPDKRNPSTNSHIHPLRTKRN